MQITCQEFDSQSDFGFIEICYNVSNYISLHFYSRSFQLQYNWRRKRPRQFFSKIHVLIYIPWSCFGLRDVCILPCTPVWAVIVNFPVKVWILENKWKQVKHHELVLTTPSLNYGWFSVVWSQRQDSTSFNLQYSYPASFK